MTVFVVTICGFHLLWLLRGFHYSKTHLTPMTVRQEMKSKPLCELIAWFVDLEISLEMTTFMVTTCGVCAFPRGVSVVSSVVSSLFLSGLPGLWLEINLENENFRGYPWCPWEKQHCGFPFSQISLQSHVTTLISQSGACIHSNLQENSKTCEIS